MNILKLNMEYGAFVFTVIMVLIHCKEIILSLFEKQEENNSYM